MEKQSWCILQWSYGQHHSSVVTVRNCLVRILVDLSKEFQVYEVPHKYSFAYYIINYHGHLELIGETDLQLSKTERDLPEIAYFETEDLIK